MTRFAHRFPTFFAATLPRLLAIGAVREYQRRVQLGGANHDRECTAGTALSL